MFEGNSKTTNPAVTKSYEKPKQSSTPLSRRNTDDSTYRRVREKSGQFSTLSCSNS